MASQSAGSASQAAGGAPSMAPSTPTRRTKIQRKVPSLSVGGHARVPDSVEVLSHTAVVSVPTAVVSLPTAV